VKGRRAPAKPAGAKAAGRGKVAVSAKAAAQAPASADGAPQVRIFPNDPDATVGLVPAEPMPIVPGQPAFIIEGIPYAPAAYDPGTPEFQYWQGEIALSRAIKVWEDLFERDFSGWQSGKPLRVLLRAGRDLNAFYDRKSLQFFYDKDKTSGRTVYASESLDVVTHEAGHAILDIYQPGYWSSVHLETAAFHEAFGDCSALLVTLTDPSVRRAFLTESEGAARASNLVSRLAEALGRAIYDNYGADAVASPSCLRDANNSFRYAPPETLPPGAPDSELAAEPHSFSRVFTGAFYDTLIWLLAREAKQKSGEEGVERARRLLGRLLGRAVETLPPGEARFLSVALRMREIDQTEEGGVASIGIEEAFAAHGMRLPALGAAAGARRVGKGRGARTGVPASRALRALDPDRPGGAVALRAALRIPHAGKLERTTTVGRGGRGVREQFIHRDWIEVRDRSLGPLSGVVVRVLCGCTLTRRASGEVEGATLAPHPHPSSQEIARHLRRWIALDAIDAGGERRRTSRQQFRARKPFRVGPRRVLERIYFE
jgi:hypothetical protein